MGGAFGRALELIVTGNREIVGITMTSLSLALGSTLCSAVLGIALALLLHLRIFAGRRIILVLLNGLMALPTVVIGLTVYTMVSGPPS